MWKIEERKERGKECGEEEGLGGGEEKWDNNEENEGEMGEGRTGVKEGG